MRSSLRNLRLVWMMAAGVGMFAAAGCGTSNPNVTTVEKPIITDDAPKSSEEAAAQSEPPPIKYRRTPR